MKRMVSILSSVPMLSQVILKNRLLLFGELGQVVLLLN